MINWIKDNFGIKNFIILMLVILIMVGILIGPSIYKMIKGIQYEGITEAEVTNIVDKRATFQNIQGINEKIIGYDVTYIYYLDSKNCTNTEVLKPNSDIKRLFDKFTSGQTCFIEIKYSLENPSESCISHLKNKE